jgi:hypothetical protein
MRLPTFHHREDAARFYRVVALVMAFALPWGALRAQRTSKAHPEKKKSLAEMEVPFRAGEQLHYQAAWNTTLTAADVQVKAASRGDFFGKLAWHFQATASTVAPVRYFFTLDDQFDSYADAQSLVTRQFEMYVREQRKNENHRLRFVPEGEPAPGDVTAVRVPRGTRDPLAALFVLRTVDWVKQASVEMPVFDGKKLYQMRARLVDANEEVETPAGSFVVSRMEIRVFEKGKERTDIRMALSLAYDAARTPVLIEAQLPFGSLRVALASKSMEKGTLKQD